MISSTYITYPPINENKSSYYCLSRGNSLFQLRAKFGNSKFPCQATLPVSNLEERGRKKIDEQELKFKWVEVCPDATEEQKQAISQLPFKMSKRCKALMRQIICFSPQKCSFSDLLAAWVRIMKPTRADWLLVIKELKNWEHPLFLEMSELALHEESFEPNVRDYTKIIHFYGKQNRLEDAKNTLLAMKRRGFICDQVTLTAMVNMYSKSGNLNLAEETFEEIKLLGEPLDKRSYGSMIMTYIRAGMPEQGEVLLREMEAQEIYAGNEIYKALLRAYSMIGDAEGAQRLFDAIQYAGISPDVRHCALLINAYQMTGQSQKALVAFENMRKAGLRPNDKCVALVLAVYEKQNKLSEALELLIDLEKDGIHVEKEASEILAVWLRRLGVVEEVELVLRDYVAKDVYFNVRAS